MRTRDGKLPLQFIYLFFMLLSVPVFFTPHRQVRKHAAFDEKSRYQSLPSLNAPRNKPNFSCCTWSNSPELDVHVWLNVNSALVEKGLHLQKPDKTEMRHNLYAEIQQQEQIIIVNNQNNLIYSSDLFCYSRLFKQEVLSHISSTAWILTVPYFINFRKFKSV